MMTTDDPWARYGKTLTRAMAEVLDEIPEELRSLTFSRPPTTGSASGSRSASSVRTRPGGCWS